MTIVYMEGFETTPTSQVSFGGNILYAGTDTGVRAGGGGIRSLRVTSAFNQTTMLADTKNLLVPDEVFVKFSIHADILTSGGMYVELFNQASVSMGSLNFSGGNLTGTLCGHAITSSSGWLNSTWYTMDIHIKFHATTGVVEVRRDGVMLSSASGLNTAQSGAHTGFRILRILKQLFTVSVSFYLDDIVINDALGSVNNSFMPDVRIVGLFPTGDISTRNDMSPSSGTDHFAVVDEFPASATDFLESTTVGDEEVFNITDLTLPTGWGIIAVQPTVLQRETVATGTANTEIGLVVGGVDYWDTANPKLLTTSDQYENGKIYEQNPNTAAGWTDANIDALRIGIRVIS